VVVGYAWCVKVLDVWRLFSKVLEGVRVLLCYGGFYAYLLDGGVYSEWSSMN